MSKSLRTRFLQLSLFSITGFCTSLWAETLIEAQQAYASGKFEMAMKISLSLAQQGVTDAEVLVGKMYLQGEGINQDVNKAYAWFESSATKGNRLGQIEIGHMNYNGVGTKRNFREAFRWYSEAANAGDINGAYEVANLYAAGEGVPQDSAQAVGWYQFAADRGHALSNFQLGRIYYEGKGGKQDRVKAYEYFTKAAEHGVRKAARARAELEKEMTASELALLKKTPTKKHNAH